MKPNPPSALTHTFLVLWTKMIRHRKIYFSLVKIKNMNSYFIIYQTLFKYIPLFKEISAISLFYRGYLGILSEVTKKKCNK